MKSKGNYFFVCVFLVLIKSGFCYAQIDINSNYWQCFIHDADNKLWSFQSSYQKIALNTVIAACKKESRQPMSCKISLSTCQEFNPQKSMRPKWLCMASDEKGTRFESDYLADRESAALNAMGQCKSNSKIPETCFINIVACAQFIDGVRQ